VISLAVGHLLVPRLVWGWQRLERRQAWLNRWLLVGLLMAGSVLVIGTNTGRTSVQAQNLSPAKLGEAREAPGTNVVVITLDTTRADHLGVYGYERAYTPNLDRWAKQGTVFWQAIAQIPLTNPNHASLFTSKYPRSHGVLRNGWLLDDVHLTLAEILAERGYATAAFVSCMPLKAKISGLQQAFQTYDDHFSLFDQYTSLMILGLANRLTGESLLERKADEVTESALAWLEENPGRPFFLWVHYFDPHFPYIPPPAYEQLHPPTDNSEVARQIALYDGEISFTDEQVGRLLNKLETAGMIDNTVLVITADHGESLGEHDYYYDHGRFLYEPSMRVPLIIVYPPAVEAGLIINDQVQTIDIMPTILHLLGLPPVDGMQGVLLPLSAGEASAQTAAFGHTFPEQKEPRGEKYSVRQGGWKYIQTPQADLAELYNLTTDPGEINNLVNVETAIAQQLEAELSEWLATTFLFERQQERAIDAETEEKLERLGY
jgi:arylsulfatase A-like enzyme